MWIYDFTIINLQLKQVCFNLLGEALTDPRSLLLFRKGSFAEGFFKDESKGVAKPLKNSRCSWPISFCQGELDPLDIYLDHRDIILEISEEESEKYLTEMQKIAEATLNISIKLKTMHILEVDVEGGVCLRAFVKSAEDSHLDRRAQIFAHHYLLKMHKEDLNRKEVMMVRSRAADNMQRVEGNHERVFGIRVLLLLFD